MSFDRNQLTDMVAVYGVPILKALMILLIGWIIAKVISTVTKKLLERTQLDDKLASTLSGGRTAGKKVEEGISRFIFWLIMLFVLMAVFEALQLRIITQPINTFVTKIVAFIPQLLAAGALALIAWVVATALRLVVQNLLSAFRLDDKVSKSTGDTRKVALTSTLADGVYYLVFLLFLPQIIDALDMDGLTPVKDMVGEILAFLPNLFGALIVFFIFYLVARIVQRLVTNLLASIGFDNLPRWLGFEEKSTIVTPASADTTVQPSTATAPTPAPGAAATATTPPAGGALPRRMSASTLAGYVAFVALIFMGAIQAFKTMELVVISSLAEELLAGLFNLLIACVIFGFGLFLARLAYRAVLASGHSQAQLLASIARIAVLVFTAAMALNRADLAPEIVNLAFGALLVGLALATGLAFGLGGREAAARTIEEWRRPSIDEPGPPR